MKRRALLFLPAVVVFLLTVWPLIMGGRSLFLRDVGNTHLPMKHAQVEAFHEGRLPLIDELRSSGQPLAGNPNSVPFYPDNLLFLIAPFLWAFNAHFWLHLLIAPFSGYWLGRAWGLDRHASWAVGVTYAASGFFLSQLNFYNLVAGAALVPALIAACLDTAGERPRRAAALAVLWALILLGGDPLTAAQAGLLSMAAVAVRYRKDLLGSLPRLGMAVVAGTLIAAPQLVEFSRILPSSFRGIWGAQGASRTVASWDPRQLVEWFVPFAFGRPDRIELARFWGFRFHTGAPPYFFSLYPGLLALVLFFQSGRVRSRSGNLWAWGSILFGLFFSLGGFNPLLSPLLGSSFSRLLRYPVKFWLPVAVGMALLCGFGYARIADGKSRGLHWILGAMLLSYGTAWTILSFFPAPFMTWVEGCLPATSIRTVFVANERLRWAGLCLISMSMLAVLWILLRFLFRGQRSIGPWALAIHATFQLFFLKPMLVTEDVEEILRPPAILESLAEDRSIFHSAYGTKAGSSVLARTSFPSNDVRWLSRRARDQGFAFAGIMAGRRYELALSPEGLDSFWTRAALDLMKIVPEAQRIRFLETWGIGTIVAFEPIGPEALDRLRLLRQLGPEEAPTWIYEIREPAPEVRFVGHVTWASDLDAAVRILGDATFDPRNMTVLSGEGRPLDVHPGHLVSWEHEGDGFAADVESEQGGTLVFQRTHLPIYRASIDGEHVPLEIADMHRIAVQIPPGGRHVRIWIDKRPSYAAWLAVVLGLMMACALGRRRTISAEQSTGGMLV